VARRTAPLAAEADHWRALGLDPGADADTLKRAFRAQARRWHPDLNANDPVAEERFKRINEAEGDVAAFTQTLEQYLKAPEITRARIYLETMAEVLPKAGSKMILDDSLRSLLPVLPLQMGSQSGNGKALEIR
jgi:regulator of protease activity HflC (stomatin/prohibitin superfamily)